MRCKQPLPIYNFYLVVQVESEIDETVGFPRGRVPGEEKAGAHVTHTHTYTLQVRDELKVHNLKPCEVDNKGSKQTQEGCDLT